MSPILPGRPSSAESSLARLVSIARAAGLLSITRALSVFVVLLLGLAGARKAPASQVPTGFTDSLLADHLDNPVALAFLPDGRLMVAELKSARIRLMVGGQVVGPIAVIDSVRGAGQEQGWLGIAIENYAGHFPLWLAPTQVMVCTITSDADEYATKVKAALRKAGLRADADLRNEKINYKVREHSLAKVPLWRLRNSSSSGDSARCVASGIPSRRDSSRHRR